MYDEFQSPAAGPASDQVSPESTTPSRPSAHGRGRCAPVRDSGRDSKLIALRKCAERAEFDELEDGRGGLLVFTEHHDTLNHLREHLES